MTDAATTFRFRRQRVVRSRCCLDYSELPSCSLTSILTSRPLDANTGLTKLDSPPFCGTGCEVLRA